MFLNLFWALVFGAMLGWLMGRLLRNGSFLSVIAAMATGFLGILLSQKIGCFFQARVHGFWDNFVIWELGASVFLIINQLIKPK